MDRKSQLRNVSFGGAWSEQITGTEELSAAMNTLEAAISRTSDMDLRQCQITEDALRMVTEAHPKGVLLIEAWGRALGLSAAHHRMAEITRICRALRAGLVDRLLG